MLHGHGESTRAVKIHRLLRVPPTGSSAADFTRNTTSCRFRLAVLRPLFLTRPSGPSAVRSVIPHVPCGIREGLPMSREPALLTSAGRMPERSQHRVSEGQDARSERPATGHGRPRTVPAHPRPRWRKYLSPGTKKQSPLTTPKMMCANVPDTHITSAVAKSTAAWI